MAEEEAERRGVRISAVHLTLGLLSGVVKDALLSSYEIACDGTPLAGSRLLITEVSVEVFCPACQGPRKLTSTQWFCCPDCATPTGEVLHGKEMQVTALEIQ